MKELKQHYDALLEAERREVQELQAANEHLRKQVEELRLEANTVRVENLKLKCRLDATLYAMVLFQGLIRQNVKAEGKPVQKEDFVRLAVDPPPGGEKR